MTNNDIIYDKISENYFYLEQIMGAFYDGNLNYEELLPALEEEKEKLVGTINDCEEDELVDKLSEVIKFTDDIMNSIYNKSIDNKEVIPTLIELGLIILKAQEYVAGNDEYLLTRIHDKKTVLIKPPTKPKKYQLVRK